MHNADELGLDLSQLSTIVLSHGHYDHTGGLPHILDRYGEATVYCHPSLVNPKFKVYPVGNLNIGVPWEESKIKAAGARLVYKSRPYEIFPDVWLSGEIPRNSSYESIDEIYQQRVLESFIHDELKDDMCLVLNTNKGLIVLLGCGHSGPINSIKQAMRITGNNRVYAVIGGMHLVHSSQEQIINITHNLVKIDPEILVPLHCTGFTALEQFFRCFGGRVQLLNVGNQFTMC